MRQYINIINEADNLVISQDQLMQAYTTNPIKPTAFVKTAIEAVIPKKSSLAQKLEPLVGKEDNTNYNVNQPYFVIQGKKGGSYEVYTNSAETLATKIPNAQPDKTIIDALTSLGISTDDVKKSGGGFFKKPADIKVYMIPARSLGVENRTIDAGWGTQEVKTGGYLVLEGFPNTVKIYCVNPDEDGLPIAYVKA